MKKNYLIAVDLDDTLVHSFDKYDTKSIELLKHLSKTNHVVIATGRPYRSTKYIYNLLDLDTPIINYNGAFIHHPKDPNFKETMVTIDKDIIIKLVEDNKNIINNLFCEVEDDIYLLNETNEIIPFLHQEGGKLTIGDFKNTLKTNPNGAIIMTKANTGKVLEDYVNSNFKGKLKIRFWNARGIVIAEVYSPFTSKGTALNIVREYLNVSKEKIIAIGDGHNDIEMIQFANYGVAMENGHPELLEVADHITDNVHNNGVYNFLANYFEIK